MANYFLDTEFEKISRTLISIAIVREDGKYLYLVMRDAIDMLRRAPITTKLSTDLRNNIPATSEDANRLWLMENVLRNLAIADGIEGWHADKAEAWKNLEQFFYGDTDIIIHSDWPSDPEYFCALITDTTGRMVPGLEDVAFKVHANATPWPCPVEGAVQHNAYWDAVALAYALTGNDIALG